MLKNWAVWITPKALFLLSRSDTDNGSVMLRLQATTQFPEDRH